MKPLFYDEQKCFVVLKVASFKGEIKTTSGLSVYFSANYQISFKLKVCYRKCCYYYTILVQKYQQKSLKNKHLCILGGYRQSRRSCRILVAQRNLVAHSSCSLQKPHKYFYFPCRQTTLFLLSAFDFNFSFYLLCPQKIAKLRLRECNNTEVPFEESN